MALEKLFEASDRKWHNYTWDYEKRENAKELLDIDERYFGLITYHWSSSEDTSPICSGGSSGGEYRGYIYSKTDPKPEEKATWGDKTEGVRDRIRDRVNALETNPVEKVLLSVGKVFISDGDLVINKIK